MVNDDDNNNKIKIGVYFSGDKNINIYDVIFEILKKNALAKNINEALADSIGNRDSALNVIYLLTKEFVVDKITEKDFISLIEKKINVSEEKAKNLLQDIKEKLIPLAVKIKIEEERIEEIENPPVKNFANSSPKKIQNFTENEIIQALSGPGPETKTGKKLPPHTETLTEKNKAKKQNTRPDSYREPIE